MSIMQATMEQSMMKNIEERTQKNINISLTYVQGCAVTRHSRFFT